MASKFKVKLKLTGFELEIEGSREDVPLMAQAVGQQMSGLLLPASGIVEGEIVEDRNLPQATLEAQPKPRKKQVSRRRSPNSTPNGEHSVVTTDWRHDPLKWGNHQQDWTTADKSIWLLYVVSKEANVSELPGSEVSATFNKHFRQSGQIRTGQINRDLGQAKGLKGKPALVSEDPTKNPSAWYITHEGEKRAQELVVKAVGQN